MPIVYALVFYHIPSLELIWALLWVGMPEVLNIFRAEDCGFDIVTVSRDILKTLKMAGMDLKALSLDTAKTFALAAATAGFRCEEA